MIEDIFSKWVEAVPTPDGRVRTVTGVLESHVFARWGYPKTIISDNGPAFHSDSWVRSMERLGIQLRYAPVYHQRSNPVERRVQELKKILRTRAEPNRPDRWDVPLQDALFCLRTRANAATGTTPSELLLGYRLRRPGEKVRDDNANQPARRQEAEPRRQRMEKAQRRQVVYQRKIFPEHRRAAASFQEGDDALTREPTVTGDPFHHVWTGPWKVTQVLGENTYAVERAGKIVPIHVDDLRAAVPDREGPVLMPPPAHDDGPPGPQPGPLPEPEPAGDVAHEPPGETPPATTERWQQPSSVLAPPHQEAQPEVGPAASDPCCSRPLDSRCTQAPTIVATPPQPPPRATPPVPMPRRRRRRARLVVL